MFVRRRMSNRTRSVATRAFSLCAVATLFHRTTAEVAARILAEGFADSIYSSYDHGGIGVSQCTAALHRDRGRSVIAVELPASALGTWRNICTDDSEAVDWTITAEFSTDTRDAWCRWSSTASLSMDRCAPSR